MQAPTHAPYKPDNAAQTEHIPHGELLEGEGDRRVAPGLHPGGVGLARLTGAGSGSSDNVTR